MKKRKPSTKAELSLGQRLDLIHEAVYRATEQRYAEERFGYCVAVYDDYVIIRADEKFWRAGYTITDNQVMLAMRSEWQEVEQQWVEVKLAQKYGSRNRADDRKRIRDIRKAARSIDAISLEMEPDDEDSSEIDPTDNTQTLIAFGEPVKTWVKGNQGFVEALGIRYGNPDETDLDQEWFSSDTDYGPHDGNGMAATLNHRIPLRTARTSAREAKFLDELARHPLKNAVEASKTELGILVRHVLDLADDYEKTIFELAERGKFRWSSGSAPHMVEREDDGKIKMWHVLEWAYTPTPAEPRLPTITPLKSLANATIDLQALLPQAAGDAATRSATEENGTAGDTRAAKRLLLELDLLTLQGVAT